MADLISAAGAADADAATTASPQPAVVRKLVSVRTITSLRPISGTQLMLAKIDHWQSAVPNGQFKPGENVVYFEIDAFLPGAEPRFSSFAPDFTTWNGTIGYHVRSKMHGPDISQGAVLPLGHFPEIESAILVLEERAGGRREAALEEIRKVDLATFLGVVKWEPPSNGGAGQAVGSLGPPPAFVLSTGMERIQNVAASFFDNYGSDEFQVTIKADGMALSVYFVRPDSPLYHSLPAGGLGTKNGRLGVCTNSCEIAETDDSPGWQAIRRRGLVAKLNQINRNVLIQGEVCGPAVAGNCELLTYHEFFVFRMIDLDGMAPVNPREVQRRTAKLGLPHIPVLWYAKLRDLARNHEEALARAAGPKMVGIGAREGIVLRNVRDGRAVKVISDQYLLSNEM